MLGAASRLAETYPRATILGFALVRTLGFVDDIDRIVEPAVGTITFRGDEANSGALRRVASFLNRSAAARIASYAATFASISMADRDYLRVDRDHSGGRSRLSRWSIAIIPE